MSADFVFERVAYPANVFASVFPHSQTDAHVSFSVSGVHLFLVVDTGRACWGDESYGEMFLLIAVYFRSNNLSPVADLVRATLGFQVNNQGHCASLYIVGINLWFFGGLKNAQMLYDC